MIKYRYEYMFPHELREVLEKRPIVYLPVSPLEWHGEHLVFGTDAFRARRVAEEVWEEIGGVIMPTLYIGTDGTKEKNGETFWGMEMFAEEKIPGSLFVQKDTLYRFLQDILFFLERTGFKLCVIVTGHMAKEQVEVLNKIEEESKERKMKVISWHEGKVKIPSELLSEKPTHAGVEETSEVMSIDLSFVDRTRYGSNTVDLKVNLEKNFLEKANKELGEKLFKVKIEGLKEAIRKNINI